MIRGFLIFFFVMMLFDTAIASTFLPNAFEGHFVQEKKLIKITEKSNILLKYQHPNNLYFKDSQTKTVYVCNATKVYKYDPPFIEGEAGNLAIGDSSKFCFSKIFDSLKPGLKNNRNYLVQKLKNSKYDFNFTKTGIKKTGIEKLEIIFKEGSQEFVDIVSMSLYLVDDARPLKLTKKDIIIKDKFPSDTFKFKRPDNALIERMQ